MDNRVETGDLCLHCGMCCTDAMFGWIPLVSDADRELMLRRGYDPERIGHDRFALPCDFLRGKACGIHPDRPASCEAFRCEVLVAAQDGTMPLDDALATVRRAVALLDGLRAALPAGETLSSMRKHWDQLDQSGMPTPPEQAQARVAFYAFNLYLDRHFRPAGKGLVNRVE
ncbi:MAG: YkgJ family cysteine cluster protein [Sphingomonadales bacterium]|nr:YkgJ family cysteine cluster protein [Sphingomonadales bacterium]MBD3772254.1 YkgJ family cysteine cluster protein [Paracoccaceae bacterium]